MIQAQPCFEILSSLGILAVMVAALCHDVDHPGNTNLYEVNTMSELALLYNDSSVLENHHCATTFRIINEGGECNIFHRLGKSQLKEVRSIIVHSILHTDMSHHFEMTAKVSTAFEGLSFLQIRRATTKALV